MSNFADHEFISKVVNQYSDTIVRIAFHYVKNKFDAEDIMQDVFFALIKQTPFGCEEHLKAWIIRAAINKTKDYLRAAKKRKTEPLESAAHLLTEHQTRVLDELQELPQKDRDVIYLHYYEGYTAKEIGEILGKREKAVLMCMGRARRKLKKILEDRP